MPVLYGGVDLKVLDRFKLRASEALVNGWVERGVRDACEVICRYPTLDDNVVMSWTRTIF